MPEDFHELHIAGIVQETHDARSYILAVPESLREAFRYRAGQFLTFEVPWDGMHLRRCYSLSSAPETDPWPKARCCGSPQEEPINTRCPDFMRPMAALTDSLFCW